MLLCGEFEYIVFGFSLPPPCSLSDSSAVRHICIPGGSDEAGQLNFQSNCDVTELSTHRTLATPVTLVGDVLAYGTPEAGVELWSLRDSRSLGRLLSSRTIHAISYSTSDQVMAIAHSKGVVSVYDVKKE